MVTVVGQWKPRRVPRKSSAAEDQLRWPLAETDLPTRNRNALEAIGVITILDLAMQRPETLMEIRMFGPDALERCRSIVKRAAAGQLVAFRDC